MDKTVPPGAALLLDFIAGPESHGSYTIIYGNHQGTLAKPITSMTIGELLTAQSDWGHRWGSSAAGRYQIMQATLTGLVHSLGLGTSEAFSPGLQDRLGYQLLKQRGYADFMTRKLPLGTFALHLAQEWASLPVIIPVKGAHRQLAIGDSYYRGDGMNAALVSAAAFEAALTKAHACAA